MLVVSKAGFLVSNNRQYALIGRSVMHLAHDYDPRQLWFPFVDALIKQSEPSKAVKPITRLGLLRMVKSSYATLRENDPARQMYIHTRGVEQIALPFEEYKMVSDNEWSILIENGCPGWDKIDNTVPRIKMAGKDFKESKEWLMDNCRGRFRYKSRSVRFERLTDYAMAKLRFS